MSRQIAIIDVVVVGSISLAYVALELLQVPKRWSFVSIGVALAVYAVYLVRRRSALNENNRIIKPTKFRHVSDDERKCRLLSLNPETLWFKDEGETDEDEHIARLEPTAEQRTDFKEIIQQGEVLSRKQILELCSPFGYDERTIGRCLEKAKKNGILKVPKFGHYSL